MAQEYTFTAKIEDGRLKVNLRALEVMRETLKGWRSCPVTVTIEKRHANRSSQANAYYFGVVLNYLNDYTEQGIDDLHEYCKRRFNAKTTVLCDKNGVIIGEEVLGQSTTKLNAVTFYEYVERVRQWMRDDLGIVTPDPDPNWRDHREEAA